ncbi:hypothetical protein [Pseudomonas baltica]|uniref:Uncharacterized protein n=1 Tax=Pseudomonas baltica TaxID=2762576 RepID=A0A7X1G1X2_9PSED|nr:hypothetical protein [Pseudomonas baltica]MBC2676943.1 hypothetical protein [Pseudomonas baltica]
MIASAEPFNVRRPSIATAKYFAGPGSHCHFKQRISHRHFIVEKNMSISTSSPDQRHHAMQALLEEFSLRGVDMQAVAEAAKLRLLGSPQLCLLPADYRVQCAKAVDELMDQATPSES